MNQPTKTISATDFKQLAQGQALPRVIDVRTPVEVRATIPRTPSTCSAPVVSVRRARRSS